MVQGNWTPCLEFSEPAQAYVSNENTVRFGAVSSGYYDNRCERWEGGGRTQAQQNRAPRPPGALEGGGEPGGGRTVRRGGR